MLALPLANPHAHPRPGALNKQCLNRPLLTGRLLVLSNHGGQIAGCQGPTTG